MVKLDETEGKDPAFKDSGRQRKMGDEVASTQEVYGQSSELLPLRQQQTSATTHPQRGDNGPGA